MKQYWKIGGNGFETPRQIHPRNRFGQRERDDSPTMKPHSSQIIMKTAIQEIRDLRKYILEGRIEIKNSKTASIIEEMAELPKTIASNLPTPRTSFMLIAILESC